MDECSLAELIIFKLLIGAAKQLGFSDSIATSLMHRWQIGLMALVDVRINSSTQMNPKNPMQLAAHKCSDNL